MKERIIGFVGTGRMGANMARRLADLGYSIGAVYDSHMPIANSLALEQFPCPAHDQIQLALPRLGDA